MPGALGFFTRLQHALKTADLRRVLITAQVHNELNLWHNLIYSLASSTTHLRLIQPHLTTWTGATGASLYGMGEL